MKASTQESIFAASSVKRPDMIIYLDSKPIAIFEVKVQASLQIHKLEDVESERPLRTDTREMASQNQLKTYSDWIHSQCSGDWPGAVFFLAHGTRTPSGFENDGRQRNSAIGVTRTWKDISSWFGSNPDLRRSGATHGVLAAEFIDFLEGQGLMTNFINFRDVAATALFMPTYRALDHTFRSVVSEVSSKHPKSKGGNVHLEFWPEANVYHGWHYLNKALNLENSRFWIGVGICFPDRENVALFGADPVGMPKHEPFFFIAIADGWENKKASELLRKIPKGWVGVNEGYIAAVTRPVSLFEAESDARAQSLTAWAQEEVARALASIPNYEAVAVEKIRGGEET